MVNLGDTLMKNKYAEQRRGSRDIYCNEWIRWSLKFLFYLPWSRRDGYVGGCWSRSSPSSSSSSSLSSYAPAFRSEWLPARLNVRHHPPHSSLLLKVRSSPRRHWRWRTYLSQWRPLGSSTRAVSRSCWRHGSPKPERTWVILFVCLFLTVSPTFLCLTSQSPWGESADTWLLSKWKCFTTMFGFSNSLTKTLKIHFFRLRIDSIITQRLSWVRKSRSV